MKFVRLCAYAVRALFFVALVTVAKDRPEPVREALMEAQGGLAKKNLFVAAPALKKAAVEIFAASMRLQRGSMESLHLAYQSTIWLSLNGQARVLEWRGRHTPTQAVIRAAGSPLPDEMERRNRLFVSAEIGEVLLGELPYNLRTSNTNEALRLDPELAKPAKDLKLKGTETLIEIRPTMQDQSIQEYLALFQMGMEKATWVFPRLLQWTSINTHSTNRWALSRLGQTPELDTRNGCAANLYSFSHHQVYKELHAFDRYEEWATDAVQKPIRESLKNFYAFQEKDFADAFDAATKNTPEGRIFNFYLNSEKKTEYQRLVGMAIDSQFKETVVTDPDPYSVEIYGAVMPSDSIRPAEVASRILDRVARRQMDLSWPMVKALAGPSGKKIEGMGIVNIDAVKASYFAELEKTLARKNFAASPEQKAIHAAIALLDSKTFLEKRKKERFDEKLKATLASVQSFENEIAVWRMMRSDSDGDIAHKDSPVVETARQLVQISNPAELREVFSAVLVDPEQDPVHETILNDKKVTEALTEFYTQIAEKWSELTATEAVPAKLEAISSEVAAKLIAAYEEKAAAEKKKIEEEDAVAAGMTPELRKELEDPFSPAGIKKALAQKVIHPRDGIPIQPRVFLTTAQKLKVIFGRLNLPLKVSKSRYRASRIIETRGQMWTLVQTRMGRLFAEHSILNPKVIQRIALSAMDLNTKKMKVSAARSILLDRFSSAGQDDVGKVEDFCKVNLREVDSEGFRLMYLSTAGTRQVLSQLIPGFKEWNVEMVKATRSKLERTVDNLTTAFLIVGAVTAVLALVVFTAGAASVAVPGMIAAALAVSTQVALPVMSLVNIYATMSLHYVEKPAQLAYQEAVASSRIFGDLPQAQGYLAQKSLEAGDPVARAMVGKMIDRNHLRAARQKLTIDQGLSFVFALLDMVWMGSTIKGAIGKSVRASMERLTVTAVKMETNQAVKVAAQQTPKAVEALNGLKRIREYVKNAFTNQIAAKDAMKTLQATMNDMMNGKALKWFRPIVEAGDLSVKFALRAGEVIGDDLVKFGAGIEDFLASQRARLDANGRLIGSFTTADISKNPDATWYGIVVKAMTGRLSQPLSSGAHWTGLTTLSELRAARSGKFITWFERFGVLRNDLLKLRGVAIAENVIAPAESLLTKVKAINNLGVEEYVAVLKKTATEAEVKVLDQLKTKGQVLMASLSDAERDILRRMVDGESFLARAVGVYKIQRSMGLRDIGRLGPVLKDYEAVMPFARSMSPAAANAYDPLNYIHEVEEGLDHGRIGAELMSPELTLQDFQQNYEVIRQFELGGIKPSPEAQKILDRMAEDLKIAL